MTPDQFVRRRQEDWKKLEALLKQAGRGTLEGLNEREVRALGDLYRAAAADLALAQRDFPRHEVTRFLNGLVGRAHHLVYRGGTVEQRTIRRFLTAGFPQLVRRNGRYVAVSTLLFFGPALLCYVLTLNDPELAYRLLPDAWPMLRRVAEDGKLWIDISPEQSSLAGAQILTNNIQVTFLAFAGGILLGLFTVYVLLLNGILLGTIFGFVQAYGLGPELGEFVIGHGVVELSVICLAGGAGLRVGHSMLAPGLMRRRDAIVQAAREAMGIITVCALLLIGAGIIEGFISPSTLPWVVKVLVGVTTGLLMWTYILRGGREKGDEGPGRGK